MSNEPIISEIETQTSAGSKIRRFFAGSLAITAFFFVSVWTVARAIVSPIVNWVRTFVFFQSLFILFIVLALFSVMFTFLQTGIQAFFDGFYDCFFYETLDFFLRNFLLPLRIAVEWLIVHVNDFLLFMYISLASLIISLLDIPGFFSGYWLLDAIRITVDFYVDCLLKFVTSVCSWNTFVTAQWQQDFLDLIGCGTRFTYSIFALIVDLILAGVQGNLTYAVFHNSVTNIADTFSECFDTFLHFTSFQGLIDSIVMAVQNTSAGIFITPSIGFYFADVFPQNFDYLDWVVAVFFDGVSAAANCWITLWKNLLVSIFTLTFIANDCYICETKLNQCADGSYPWYVPDVFQRDGFYTVQPVVRTYSPFADTREIRELFIVPADQTSPQFGVDNLFEPLYVQYGAEAATLHVERNYEISLDDSVSFCEYVVDNFVNAHLVQLYNYNGTETEQTLGNCELYINETVFELPDVDPFSGEQLKFFIQTRTELEFVSSNNVGVQATVASNEIVFDQLASTEVSAPMPNNTIVEKTAFAPIVVGDAIDADVWRNVTQARPQVYNVLIRPFASASFCANCVDTFGLALECFLRIIRIPLAVIDAVIPAKGGACRSANLPTRCVDTVSQDECTDIDVHLGTAQMQYVGDSTSCSLTEPTMLGVGGDSNDDQQCFFSDSGNCLVDVSPVECASLGGIPQPKSIDCAFGPGTCVLSEIPFVCADPVPKSICQQQGGQFRGRRTPCSKFFSETGACQLTGNLCVDIIDENECEAIQGTFKGDNTLCAPISEVVDNLIELSASDDSRSRCKIGLSGMYIRPLIGLLITATSCDANFFDALVEFLDEVIIQSTFECPFEFLLAVNSNLVTDIREIFLRIFDQIPFIGEIFSFLDANVECLITSPDVNQCADNFLGRTPLDPAASGSCTGVLLNFNAIFRGAAPQYGQAGIAGCVDSFKDCVEAKKDTEPGKFPNIFAGVGWIYDVARIASNIALDQIVCPFVESIYCFRLMGSKPDAAFGNQNFVDTDEEDKCVYYASQRFLTNDPNVGIRCAAFGFGCMVGQKYDANELNHDPLDYDDGPFPWDVTRVLPTTDVDFTGSGFLIPVSYVAKAVVEVVLFLADLFTSIIEPIVRAVVNLGEGLGCLATTGFTGCPEDDDDDKLGGADFVFFDSPTNTVQNPIYWNTEDVCLGADLLELAQMGQGPSIFPQFLLDIFAPIARAACDKCLDNDILFCSTYEVCDDDGGDGCDIIDLTPSPHLPFWCHWKRKCFVQLSAAFRVDISIDIEFPFENFETRRRKRSESNFTYTYTSCADARQLAHLPLEKQFVDIVGVQQQQVPTLSSLSTITNQTVLQAAEKAVQQHSKLLQSWKKYVFEKSFSESALLNGQHDDNFQNYIDANAAQEWQRINPVFATEISNLYSFDFETLSQKDVLHIRQQVLSEFYRKSFAKDSPKLFHANLKKMRESSAVSELLLRYLAYEENFLIESGAIDERDLFSETDYFATVGELRESGKTAASALASDVAEQKYSADILKNKRAHFFRSHSLSQCLCGPTSETIEHLLFGITESDDSFDSLNWKLQDCTCELHDSGYFDSQSSKHTLNMYEIEKQFMSNLTWAQLTQQNGFADGGVCTDTLADMQFMTGEYEQQWMKTHNTAPYLAKYQELGFCLAGASLANLLPKSVLDEEEKAFSYMRDAGTFFKTIGKAIEHSATHGVFSHIPAAVVDITGPTTAKFPADKQHFTDVENLFETLRQQLNAKSARAKRDLDKEISASKLFAAVVNDWAGNGNEKITDEQKQWMTKGFRERARKRSEEIAKDFYNRQKEPSASNSIVTHWTHTVGQYLLGAKNLTVVLAKEALNVLPTRPWFAAGVQKYHLMRHVHNGSHTVEHQCIAHQMYSEHADCKKMDKEDALMFHVSHVLDNIHYSWNDVDDQQHKVFHHHMRKKYAKRDFPEKDYGNARYLHELSPENQRVLIEENQNWTSGKLSEINIWPKPSDQMSFVSELLHSVSLAITKRFAGASEPVHQNSPKRNVEQEPSVWHHFTELLKSMDTGDVEKRFWNAMGSSPESVLLKQKHKKRTTVPNENLKKWFDNYTLEVQQLYKEKNMDKHLGVIADSYDSFSQKIGLRSSAAKHNMKVLKHVGSTGDVSGAWKWWRGIVEYVEGAGFVHPDIANEYQKTRKRQYQLDVKRSEGTIFEYFDGSFNVRHRRKILSPFLKPFANYFDLDQKFSRDLAQEMPELKFRKRSFLPGNEPSQKLRMSDILSHSANTARRDDAFAQLVKRRHLQPTDREMSEFRQYMDCVGLASQKCLVLQEECEEAYNEHMEQNANMYYAVPNTAGKTREQLISEQRKHGDAHLRMVLKHRVTAMIWKLGNSKHRMTEVQIQNVYSSLQASSEKEGSSYLTEMLVGGSANFVRFLQSNLRSNENVTFDNDTLTQNDVVVEVEEQIDGFLTEDLQNFVDDPQSYFADLFSLDTFLCEIPADFDGTNFWNPLCGLFPENILGFIEPLPTHVFPKQIGWPDCLVLQRVKTKKLVEEGPNDIIIIDNDRSNDCLLSGASANATECLECEYIPYNATGNEEPGFFVDQDKQCLRSGQGFQRNVKLFYAFKGKLNPNNNCFAPNVSLANHPLCPACDATVGQYLSCQEDFGWSSPFDSWTFMFSNIPRWYNAAFVDGKFSAIFYFIFPIPFTLWFPFLGISRFIYTFIVSVPTALLGIGALFSFSGGTTAPPSIFQFYLAHFVFLSIVWLMSRIFLFAEWMGTDWALSISNFFNSGASYAVTGALGLRGFFNELAETALQRSGAPECPDTFCYFWTFGYWILGWFALVVTFFLLRLFIFFMLFPLLLLISKILFFVLSRFSTGPIRIYKLFETETDEQAELVEELEDTTKLAVEAQQRIGSLEHDLVESNRRMLPLMQRVEDIEEESTQLQRIPKVENLFGSDEEDDEEKKVQ